MQGAELSEIFLSLQGEGLYVGVPQVFVRFHGCNLSCAFCDTKPAFHNVFTKEALAGKIAEYKKPYHSISLTGGEPLVQADFIGDFLAEYKKFYKKPVYLETNGTLHKELNKVIDYVDIISMDFKLPSSTEKRSLWKEHEAFLRLAKKKEIFIKAVITGKTTFFDVVRMREIVAGARKDIPIVLQPVTLPNDVEAQLPEPMERFRKMLKKSIKRIEIIPQVHKLIGVK